MAMRQKRSQRCGGGRFFMAGRQPDDTPPPPSPPEPPRPRTGVPNFAGGWKVDGPIMRALNR